MKPIIQIILIILLTFAVVPTNATALTGNKLLKFCEEGMKTPPDYQQSAYCNGYITGAVDGMFYLDTQKRLCPPKEATREQVTRIVVKYLKENPQRLHEDYTPIIFSAITEAFPCKSDFPE